MKRISLSIALAASLLLFLVAAMVACDNKREDAFTGPKSIVIMEDDQGNQFIAQTDQEIKVSDDPSQISYDEEALQQIYAIPKEAWKPINNENSFGTEEQPAYQAWDPNGEPKAFAMGKKLGKEGNEREVVAWAGLPDNGSSYWGGGYGGGYAAGGCGFRVGWYGAAGYCGYRYGYNYGHYYPWGYNPYFYRPYPYYGGYYGGGSYYYYRSGGFYGGGCGMYCGGGYAAGGGYRYYNYRY